MHLLAFIYDIIMQPYSMKSVLGILIYSFDLISLGIFATLPVYLKTTSNTETFGRAHIYVIATTLCYCNHLRFILDNYSSNGCIYDSGTL